MQLPAQRGALFHGVLWLQDPDLLSNGRCRGLLVPGDHNDLDPRFVALGDARRHRGPWRVVDAPQADRRHTAGILQDQGQAIIHGARRHGRDLCLRQGLDRQQQAPQRLVRQIGVPLLQASEVCRFHRAAWKLQLERAKARQGATTLRQLLRGALENGEVRGLCWEFHPQRALGLRSGTVRGQLVDGGRHLPRVVEGHFQRSLPRVGVQETVLQAALGSCHLERCFREVAPGFPVAVARIQQLRAVAGEKGAGQMNLREEPRVRVRFRQSQVRQVRLREVLAPDVGVEALIHELFVLLRERGRGEDTPVRRQAFERVEGERGLSSLPRFGGRKAHNLRRSHTALGQGARLVGTDHRGGRQVIHRGDFHDHPLVPGHLNGAHPQHDGANQRNSVGNQCDRHDDSTQSCSLQEASLVLFRARLRRVLVPCLEGYRSR
mmetsp:Transcript_120296/g.285845  ORF Transcript_120296/g.285845 Transcript_120296/m.285845 type:complete len:435 (+) Transcript_120296:424-1728(+)